MKQISRILVIVTVAAYVLVAVAGLLRISGADSGGADWPRVYGQWLPPTSNAQARELIAAGRGAADAHTTTGADLDPSRYNVLLAWLDYLHRWLGVAVILTLLAATALVMRRDARRHVDVAWPIMAALGLATATVVLMATAGREPSPRHSTGLLLAGLGLLGASVLATLRAHRCAAAGDADLVGPTPFARLLGRGVAVLALVTLLQMLVGTALRGQVDWLIEHNPGIAQRDLLAALGLVKYLHMGMGMGFVALGYGITILLMRRRDAVTPAAVYIGRLLLILLTIQMAIGFAFGAGGLTPQMKVAHLWLAITVFGVWVLLAAILASGDSLPALRPRPLLKWSVGGIGVVAAMALLATVTIQQAQLTRDSLPVYGDAPQFRFPAVRGGEITEFGNAEMAGTYTIVAFMFTSCPSICPVQSARIAELNEVFRGAPEVQFLSLTVDPDTDTLPVLADYAAGWNADAAWIFARGERSETQRVAGPEGFGLRYDFPNHSPKLSLVDPSGQIRGYYDSMDAMEIVRLRADLTTLIGPAIAAPDAP